MLSFPQTAYFHHTRMRPDRAIIQDEWIEQVIHSPEKQIIQNDGRIRLWARIAEYGYRALRVVLLEDGKTIHNAFFDRDYHEDGDEN